MKKGYFLNFNKFDWSKIEFNHIQSGDESIGVKEIMHMHINFDNFGSFDNMGAFGAFDDTYLLFVWVRNVHL